jgi:two-component system, NtrC family, sensor kinase
MNGKLHPSAFPLRPVKEVAVRTSGLGEAATQLPWLTPAAASLVALSRAPSAAAWEVVCADPGGVLLLVREAFPRGAVTGLSFFPAMLRDPAVPEAALRYLARPGPGFADWNQPELWPFYQASQQYARSARLVAERANCCAADNAWVGGLLAPLGWLAAATADPAATADCLRAPGGGHLDHAAIARRLGLAWRLPVWLSTIAGHLALPGDVAQTLGADPPLFQVVQLAVTLVQRQGAGLGLAVGSSAPELAAALGLTSAEVQDLEAAIGDCLRRPLPLLAWEPPERMPLLPELLRLAADNLRLRDFPALDALQRDVDNLERALVEQRAGEEGRLQGLKLGALAELAAGAGHEINNPLAVISGQAQYLLAHEEEPARRRALQTITGQAQRIHHILTELMQFARPPAAHKQFVDVPGLVRDVVESLQGLAGDRKVRLVCPEPEPVTLLADPAQARTALTCLLRNAIEAAPAEGWAGVRVESSANGTVDLVVEDNGGGLAQVNSEHIFDPFYSGRKAGRGRGLGLPTAWRLARQQDGDVSFDAAGPPTRFILTLPKGTAHQPRLDRNGVSGGHVPTAASA